jgi:hypothetical protein
LAGDVKLSQHDLQQLDEDAVRGLPEAALRHLTLTLLADLKEARERLAQNPRNSSRPPSSRSPWERGTPAAEPGSEQTAPESATTTPERPRAEAQEALTPAPGAGTARGWREGKAEKRKPGKQPGAPGVGRTQVFTAHHTEEHRPTVCARCAQPLSTTAAAVSYTGFQSLDLHWGDPTAPGLRLHIIDHRYLEVSCACGHHSRAQPAQGEVDPELGALRVREWRLVGPGLATLIVALNLRFRLSRARIQEWLHDWLGVSLSVGTIHQTLHEVGAVLAPAGAQLIAAAQASALLHADETSWPQQDQSLWLWVFITTTTTLYVIARRGKATVVRLLSGFTGWLMSDGWFVYRGYPQRLRCWAHLLRKAQGLVECYDPDGRAFGRQLRATLEDCMVAIYAAREGPPPDGEAVDLPRAYARQLELLRQGVTARLSHRHDKTQALAVELYNDWEAIFQVLHHPELPLTNNAAERALRHWVIARRLSHGTRTAVGSHVFTLLASVIDTCRQRGHSPWNYLLKAIADRRGGLPLAPLPQPGV